MPHTDFYSNIKEFPYSGRAELFGLVHLWIKIISCVWVTAKVCDKDNEPTGEQRKRQFLQAKTFRGDVTGMMGPTWEHEKDDLIQEIEQNKRECFRQGENGESEVPAWSQGGIKTIQV